MANRIPSLASSRGRGLAICLLALSAACLPVPSCLDGGAYLGGFSMRVDAGPRKVLEIVSDPAARFGLELEPKWFGQSDSTSFVEECEIHIQIEDVPKLANTSLVTVTCRCEWPVAREILESFRWALRRAGITSASIGYPDTDPLQSPSAVLLELRRRWQDS